MNKKIIKSIIKNKLNRWIASIEDEKVRKLAEKNTILTGGAIANLLLSEEVKDFDIYFRNKETTLAVANYYVDKFNKRNTTHTNKLGGKAKAYVLDGEFVQDGKLTHDANPELRKEFANQGSTLTRMIAGCTPDRVKIIVRSDGVAADKEYKEVLDQPFEDAVEVLEAADQVNEKTLTEENEPKEQYRPVFLSTNAITLTDKIQIVVRFYGEPEVIHKNYDFVHCTNYYDNGKEELVLFPEALECLINKELKYMGSKYPVCSVIRTRKFIKRGFHINAGQYLKMCFQISELDLTNIDVLEDQLVGVDSCYFMQLIDALRSKQENDPNFKVEENYVTSIIDRIF
jgi:hypothetical protein